MLSLSIVHHSIKATLQAIYSVSRDGCSVPVRATSPAQSCGRRRHRSTAQLLQSTLMKLRGARRRRLAGAWPRARSVYIGLPYRLSKRRILLQYANDTENGRVH